MKVKSIPRVLNREKMKLPPLPKLEETRLGQVWFVFSQVFKLSWQVSPKLLSFTLLVNGIVGLLIYPTLKLEKAFIDSLIENVGADFWSSAGWLVILILFLRFAVGLARDILSRVGRYLQQMMSSIFSAYLDILMARRNAELDIVTLDSPEFKNRFSKIRQESGRRAWRMMASLGEAPMILMGMISSLIIIFSFQPEISLIIIFLSIPVFLTDTRFVKREYRFRSETSPLHRMWGWLNYYLVEPRNILEVKLLKLSGPFSKRMQVIQNRIFSGRIKIEKEKTIWQTIASIPQNIFHLAIGVYLAFLVFVARLSVGSAEMILRAITSFRDNLSSLVSHLLELYENYLYVADFVWLLSLKPSIAVSRKGKKLSGKLKKGIDFKDVCFRYTDNSPWILKDVNFRIDPSENIAIVGENGAGKSTLVKLICRFYDPQRGKILLNGVDLKKYSVKSLWDNLSVLFQEFEVYPFSAKESIAYGDVAEIGKLDLIKKAAKKAEIDEFIESLPLGYKNPLDPQFEKGIRPSLGQWQRIALARVFLKDAKITILDEPTSNVDPRAEEQIFRRIMKYSQGKMLVLISHRFHTVRQADKIIVLDKGKIIEEGRHDELMSQDGRYAQLFELQAKGYR